jgi:hypothetical protein
METIPTVEISGSHGGGYEVTVFWDVQPCGGLVKTDRRFTGPPSSHQS